MRKRKSGGEPSKALKLKAISSASFLLDHDIAKVSLESVSEGTGRVSSGTDTPHFAAPVFSSCSRTQCSASGSAAAISPSASLLGGSSLHSAMSSALLGKSSLPPLSSGSSAGAEEAVACNAPRRADRSSDRVVEALTGIRIVAGKQALSVQAVDSTACREMFTFGRFEAQGRQWVTARLPVRVVSVRALDLHACACAHSPS